MGKIKYDQEFMKTPEGESYMPHGATLAEKAAAQNGTTLWCLLSGR